MKKLWNFLQGKKTSIATISGAVLIYLLNNGNIDAETAQLISIILASLGLSANIGNAVVNKAKNDKVSS